MAVGKRFSIDKPDTNPVQLTKWQAFADFWIFIGLSAAYIVQVSEKICFKTFKDRKRSSVIQTVPRTMTILDSFLLFTGKTG